MNKINISLIKLAAYATMTVLSTIYFIYLWCKLGFKECFDMIPIIILLLNLTIDNDLLLSLRTFLAAIADDDKEVTEEENEGKNNL